MDKTLKLIGRSSNEIYVLRYPSSVLDFCEYDLSYFAKKAVEACSEAQKTGEVDFDRFSELKRDIQNAHCYIEHHIRTIYEKLPIDCYIDYLCRRDSIGTGTLWNRFISCRTQFDKMMFQRLCELRYNRAINEWLNILRVRDYAVSKVEFVFPDGITSASEASARRNYFDLMFSVTASEMGCKLDELGQTKVFSIGRLPNSPFMFPAISKDIIRTVLSDFDYSDDYSDIKDYGSISDEIAMDAFSRMKSGLSAELSSYNILRSKMEKYDKIYMPCSLKAVIDLEIDAVIESGGYLAVCKKCGRRYYRGKDYDEDYCNYLHNGKSCLDEYREENPPRRMTDELEQKSRSVTNNVYARVGKSLSTKEYEYWYSYMTAMKEKVNTGEISPEEFDDFLDYSLTFDISRSKPIVEVPKPQTGKVVKPFIPERIERSSIKKETEEDDTKEPETFEFENAQSAKDGFFLSPSVSRRSSERRISHIIRAGEPRGEDSYNSRPNPSDFKPFVQTDSQQNSRPVRGQYTNEQPARGQTAREQYADSRTAREQTVRKQSAYEQQIREHEQPSYQQEQPTQFVSTTKTPPGRRNIEPPEQAVKPFSAEILKSADIVRSSDEDSIENRLLEELKELRGKNEPQTGFSQFTGDTGFEPFVGERNSDLNEAKEQPVAEAEKPVKRARVIKKNAAAISAYGKMSGAPIISAPPEMDIVSRANNADAGENAPQIRRILPSETAPEPDKDPFKDIDSIFDVVEGIPTAEQPSGRRSQTRESRFEPNEPAPEWSDSEREYPTEVTKENAPSGIWTEDRNLYREEQKSELDILKEKKQRTKTNKTKHLFDAIMREPDDNPNVRKK